MREIKFRAWNKEEKCMIYSDEVYPKSEYKFEFEIFNNFKLTLMKMINRENAYHKDGEETHIEYFEPVDAEIMQYTGIKDSNGNEIYEGDIVEFLDEEVNYSHCGVEYDEFINIGKVIFSHDELMGWDITNRNMDLEEVWHYREYIKVIGNIYENPELLEGRF